MGATASFTTTTVMLSVRRTRTTRRRRAARRAPRATPANRRTTNRGEGLAFGERRGARGPPWGQNSPVRVGGEARRGGRVRGGVESPSIRGAAAFTPSDDNGG